MDFSKKKILTIADDCNMEQLVTFPTRRDANGTENILDLCFTTRPSHVTDVRPQAPIADHSIVMVEISTHAPVQVNPPRTVYLWNKIDDQAYKRCAKEFTEGFLNDNPEERTVDSNWCLFRDTILGLVKKHVPSKQVQGKCQPPWFTHKHKRLCRRKERYYIKAKQKGGQQRWDQFKKVRNEVDKELRKANRDYVADLSTTEDKKKFWNYIRSRKKDNVGIQTLKIGHKTITDDQTKADTLAEQFQSVFTKEDPVLPTLPNSHFTDMNDIEITVDGVEKLLCTLKINKAVGPDGIPNAALKLAAAELAPALQFIFTQSLDHSELPEDWKRANISPIFKKGSKADPANYRPISLTCVCCKLLEHILDSQLMKFLAQHDILSDAQHAFRKSRSCDTQLITTLHDLTSNHNNNQTTDIAILDFSKAFDVVPHQRLLQKLNYCGIRNKPLGWIKAFLTNRSQRVVVKGKSSPWMPVLSGVPQGTVLGPHLFILYINDITETINSTTRLFADDCIMYRPINSPNDKVSFQSDLTKLVNWSHKWGMKFNATKCKVMRISRKRQPGKANYSMLGETLEEVSEEKYLGVILQNNLKWNKQSHQAASKATRMLNFIQRNFYHCSKTTKENLYLTFVQPHLEYASAAWNPGTKKNQDALQKVQRRAARFVQGDYKSRSSVTEMLEVLNWNSIEDRRQTQRLTTFYKILNNLIDIDQDCYVRPKELRSRRCHDKQFALFQHTSTPFIESFFPETVSLWNALPQQAVNSISSESFKTLVQSHNQTYTYRPYN